MVGAQPELREKGSHVGGRPLRNAPLEAIDEWVGTGEIGTRLVDLTDGDIGAQTRTTLIGPLPTEE